MSFVLLFLAQILRVLTAYLRYWNFEMDLEKFAMTKVAEPLPSDCRYREDIIYLHAEDIQGASEYVVP